jgi:glutathione S-transferase
MSEFILWGVIASPYQLKMQALLDYAEHSWKRLPAQGGRWQNILINSRLTRATRRGQVLKYPSRMAPLDEYPSVPFYTEDGHRFYYDSTALAAHLDAHSECHSRKLVPGSPLERFVCNLLDEAFDEFGLYMVHHMRWVGSAKTNRMGEITAGEMSRLVPLGLHRPLARQLPRRQVRRCPYLFSVAPEAYVAGVEPALTPPGREGFPPTHALLDDAWEQYLAAMEHLLSQQSWLLGERFTLADASAYGQLSMNLIDGAACERLQELAPKTHAWLCAIRDGEHVGSDGSLVLGDALAPLLEIVGKTFVPLMQQNMAAHAKAIAAGETLFNEAAFDKGRALYDGELMGHPYRAVVKTFQVQVWRTLLEEWRALGDSERKLLLQFLPSLES